MRFLIREHLTLVSLLLCFPCKTAVAQSKPAPAASPTPQEQAKPTATPAPTQPKSAATTAPAPAKTATPAPIASPTKAQRIIPLVIPGPTTASPPPAIASPTPINKATPTEKTLFKGPRIAFKINLNLSRGNASTSVRTSLNLAKGESTVIGGLMRTMCQDDVCPKERTSCPQKCETLHEDIKMTLTEFKNDVVHCSFEIVGPTSEDHIGFVVTGKVFTTISFNLQGDLKAKLLLTPSLL